MFVPRRGRRSSRPEELGRDSVAEVAAHAAVVITVLPGPDEVSEICEGLIAALSPGATWIDMSTGTPAVAAEIAPMAFRRDVRTLDAPVGGGPVEAREGRLVAFVGARPRICSGSADSSARLPTRFFTLGPQAADIP